jgi:uncharacterized protein with GYD domain
MNKYLGSSADPNKISLTIKSVGVWLIPAIILIGKYSGVDIAEADLTEIVNSIAVLVASAMSLYGLGRKAYYKYF